MDDYKKVVSSKLKFKGSMLPVKDASKSIIFIGFFISRKKRSKKEKAKLEKLILKPEERKDYLPVEPVEDHRTEAEKRFDERLKYKVKDWVGC